MDKTFTLNVLLYGLLGWVLGMSEVSFMDKPLNFTFIVVLVMLIQYNNEK